MEGKTVLRGILTVALLGCGAVRVFRMAAGWQSVAAFYGIGTFGPGWSLIGLLLFTGPFLAALAAGAGLWLRRDLATAASMAALCVSGFFVLEEGLVVFARAMNGNGGYVGAEPLLSGVVCVAAGIALLLSQERKA